MIEVTIVTAGIVCVIAAIIGGGLTARGFKVPVIGPGRRQVGLGTFGALLLVVGLLLELGVIQDLVPSREQKTAEQKPVHAVIKHVPFYIHEGDTATFIADVLELPEQDEEVKISYRWEARNGRILGPQEEVQVPQVQY